MHTGQHKHLEQEAVTSLRTYIKHIGHGFPLPQESMKRVTIAYKTMSWVEWIAYQGLQSHHPIGASNR